MAALRQHFKPELLNRMDDIIIFHSLKGNDFVRIAEKMMNDLRKRLAGQEISLTVSPEVLDWVVKEGTDPEFGARPLKRFIQRHVETAVARELIKGEALGSKLEVTVEDGTVKVDRM